MRQVAAGAALTVALAGIVGGVYIAQQPTERVELIQPASGVPTLVPVETSEPTASPTAVPTTTAAETTALPRVNVEVPVAEPAPAGQSVSPKPAQKQQVQSKPAPVSSEPHASAPEEPAPVEPAPPAGVPTTTNAGTSSPLPTPDLSMPTPTRKP